MIVNGYNKRQRVKINDEVIIRSPIDDDQPMDMSGCERRFVTGNVCKTNLTELYANVKCINKKRKISSYTIFSSYLMKEKSLHLTKGGNAISFAWKEEKENGNRPKLDKLAEEENEKRVVTNDSRPRTREAHVDRFKKDNTVLEENINAIILNYKTHRFVVRTSSTDECAKSFQ
ncbi:hypothetical protein K501DRAFT_272173 [Backusella circina FSU 941]|nr:hypothetical protein K501DRAFT_272173 [Backusella circina FSU 941]